MWNSCGEKEMHELWLMILANIKFSDERKFQSFLENLDKVLTKDDIKYLISYLRNKDGI